MLVEKQMGAKFGRHFENGTVFEFWINLNLEFTT